MAKNKTVAKVSKPAPALKADKAKAPAAKPATVKVLTEKTAIVSLIAGIQRRGQSLAKDAHIAACSIIQHIQDHGDITLAQKLVDALPDMTRKNALRDWFLAHGKLLWEERTDADGKVVAEFRYAKHGITKLAEGMATPFWKFTPEAHYIPFNLVKAMDMLFNGIDRARKHNEKLPEGIVSDLMDIRDRLKKEETAKQPAIAAE